MSQFISAHGRTYETVAAANARIAELSLGNMLSGPSDGRMTEINAILQSMIDVADAHLGHNTYKDVHGVSLAVRHVQLSLSLQAGNI